MPLDYGSNRATLLLAISTDFHFCTESAPFFRKAAEAGHNRVKIVAVLSEPASEGRRYLSENGIPVDDVRQFFLGGLGVAGTPTMMLVDGNGVVRHIWVGKLAAGDEDKVLTVLKSGIL